MRITPITVAQIPPMVTSAARVAPGSARASTPSGTSTSPIRSSNQALVVAGIVVAIELVAIAWVRHKFLHVTLRSSLLVVTLGGAIVLAIGVAIGSA